MSHEEQIIRGLRPRVTELSGNEEQADAATFSASCALLRRYTSQIYIAEAAALFGTMVRAFENWPQAADHFGERTLLEWMPVLKQQQVAYERGLAQLDADTAAAYASIVLASNDMEPRNPRDERHFSLSTVANALGEPMIAIGEKLGAMAERIHITLCAGWAYQKLINDPVVPAQDETSVAAEDLPTVETGLRIAETGIWVPTTIRYGCPNVLIAGRPAPPMSRACKRYDYAARSGSGLLDPPRAARSDYEYVVEPTVWRMVWRDTRYPERA